MSNRPKNKKGLHILDSRRRAKAKAAVEVRVEKREDLQDLPRHSQADRGSLNGLFLDDWRPVDYVSSAYHATAVTWHKVINFNAAQSLIEKWIEGGISIDRLSLDYDLGWNESTGLFFFNWFIRRIKEEAAKPDTKLNINKWIFDVEVHSSHPTGKYEIMDAIPGFISWLRENQTDDNPPKWKTVIEDSNFIAQK